MNWYFYATKNLEPWDWRNPDAKGIGNSETSQIEMAGRLALRGHTVTSYTWLPADTPADPRGVIWKNREDADFSQPGIWVLYRCPEMLDQFSDPHPNQLVWLMFQDTHYDSTNPERAAKVDKAIALCEGQRDFLAQKFPEIADKLSISSNGIRMDMIAEVEAEGIPEKNPHRLHFSSSPDRGLKVLLTTIFPRVREHIPDLELHVYYGWNNIEKLMETADGKEYFGPNKRETERLLTQPGVVWHGRVGQRELTREWLKAGIWCFPSMYPETSCATCMEAQALGAIPLVMPLWALRDNVRWGAALDGNVYDDKLVQMRWVAQLLQFCSPEYQDSIRPQMMADARAKFSWDNFVAQWEGWANESPNQLSN